MNTDNQYSTAGIQYGYQRTLRKWSFTDGKFTFATSVKNGRENAVKIACQVAAGLKRSKGNGLDNLARFHISKFENYV